MYLQNENVVLKSSIEECTSTIQLVHSEMNGLKTIANDGVSKLRKREKKLLDEQRKDKDVIAEMEKKLEHANSLIHSLQSSSMGGMYSKPVGQHSTPPAFAN
jgi:predicted  nucleic acid-binding Zn-ribbon protein